MWQVVAKNQYQVPWAGFAYRLVDRDLGMREEKQRDLYNDGFVRALRLGPAAVVLLEFWP
jgi:hypothetical protein